jgi:hypothetical protein
LNGRGSLGTSRLAIKERVCLREGDEELFDVAAAFVELFL